MLTSPPRQVLLAVVGILAIVLSLVLDARRGPTTTPVAQETTTTATTTATTTTATTTATTTTEQPPTSATPSVVKSPCAIQINPNRKTRATDFTIAINGSGYQPGEQVRFFLVLETKLVLDDGTLNIGGQTLAEVTADEHGAVRHVQGQFHHISQYATGPHYVVGLGLSSTCKADKLFIVDEG